MLDPDRRYLLARPLGGFNDMLVQIERCLSYAERYDRDVILDTRKSGIKVHFDTLFELPAARNIKVHTWSEEIGEELDKCGSVYPPNLRHATTKLDRQWHRTQRVFCDRRSGEILSFDFSRDHQAKVLVHVQAGGGSMSFRALRRTKLKPEIASKVVDRIKGLGPDYDAIHIRHSDYKTKYLDFLFSLRSAVRGRRVLICSDNAKAKRVAGLVLPISTRLLSISDVPDLRGRPIHRSRKVDASAANLDMLSDLYALALSQTLFAEKVTGGWRNEPLWSGFTLLAFMLQKDRTLVLQHLHLEDRADWADQSGQSAQEERRSRKNRIAKRHNLSLRIAEEHPAIAKIVGDGSMADDWFVGAIDKELFAKEQ